MKQDIILVNEKDEPRGRDEKLKVHQQGKLHRAFSVFIFNSKGEWLLQKRAQSKYHSPGLWSNACCSHPRYGKDILREAKKRLKEEMGIVSFLKEIFVFSYRVKLGALSENEIDHVFTGTFNGVPEPSKKEAAGWKWISFLALKKDIKENPQNYTYWFKMVFDKVWEYYFKP